MKRLLFGFLVGVVLSWTVGARAGQESASVAIIPERLHDSSSLDITVADLVDVIASFDVHHMDQPPVGRPMYGMTVFDTSPPAMFIFNGQTFDSKRGTVVHEAIHVKCEKLRLQCAEEYVADQEARQYLGLFGSGK